MFSSLLQKLFPPATPYHVRILSKEGKAKIIADRVEANLQGKVRTEEEIRLATEEALATEITQDESAKYLADKIRPEIDKIRKSGEPMDQEHLTRAIQAGLRKGRGHGE